MKAAADRTLADLRAEALRSMTVALPSLVEGVEQIATDATATHHDRIAAFKALAEKVFPGKNGWDHVGHQVNAEGARDHQRAAGEQNREIQDLLRLPREEVDQRIVASLVDGGHDPEGAARLVELWYAVGGGTVGRDPRADLAAVMEDLWRAAVGMDANEPPPPEIDEPDEADVVPLRAIEATATEEFSARSTNGDGDAVQQLVNELTCRGLSPLDLVSELRAVDHEVND